MNFKTGKILGINVTISSTRDDLEEIRKYFNSKNKKQRTKNKNSIKPLIIFTPNPEIISYAQKDADFARIVNTAQINLPDGAGVVWAIKRLYGVDIEQISGVDFMLQLAKIAREQGLRIGLIGGRRGVAVGTAECLRRTRQNMKIEVFDAPEIEVSRTRYQVSGIDTNMHHTKYLILNTRGNDEQVNKYFQKLAEKIIEKRIDILFVALGFPKQEYFIDRISKQLTINNYQSPIVLMAVGGAFDYISGRVPRAPLLMRKSGLEWLFRLIREPWRAGRQLKGIKFFIDVLTSV